MKFLIEHKRRRPTCRARFVAPSRRSQRCKVLSVNGNIKLIESREHSPNTVATYHAPPECISKIGELVRPDALLAEIDQKGGKDKAKKANVNGGDELLTVCIDDGAEQLPGATATVHADHAKNLKEPKTSKGRGGKHLAGAADR